MRVIQASLFDFSCYRAIDYPLIFGNFVGIACHVVMALYLLYEVKFGSPVDFDITKGETEFEVQQKEKPFKTVVPQDWVYTV